MRRACCGPASSPARSSNRWLETSRSVDSLPAPRVIALCTMRPPPPSKSCRPTTSKCAPEVAAREEKVAVLAMRPPLQTPRHMTWINAGKRPDVYAHNLYNHLRTLDRAGCVRIFVQSLPQDERWAAILDRLQRASGMGDDSLELSVS